MISTNPPVMWVCLPWQKIFPNYESFFTSKLYLLTIFVFSSKAVAAAAAVVAAAAME